MSGFSADEYALRLFRLFPYSPVAPGTPGEQGIKESRTAGPQGDRYHPAISSCHPAIGPATHTNTQLHSVTLKKPAPPKPKPTAAHAAGGAAVVAAPAAPGAVGRPVPAVPEASTHTRLFPLMLLGYDYYR